MKFLVLALCVCAASAASFGSFGKKDYKQYQPQLNAKTFVQSVPTPVVVPTVYAAAKATYDGVANAIYEAPAAKNAYSNSKDAAAAIVRSSSEVNADGFNYFYETNNGIAAQASGVSKKAGNEVVLAVQGSYKYINNEGKEVLVTYVADENGFQPQSDILPVGPAIPEPILRSLEYIKNNYKPEKRENY